MLERYAFTLMLTLALAGAGGPVLFSLTGDGTARAAASNGGALGR